MTVRLPNIARELGPPSSLTGIGGSDSMSSSSPSPQANAGSPDLFIDVIEGDEKSRAVHRREDKLVAATGRSVKRSRPRPRSRQEARFVEQSLVFFHGPPLGLAKSRVAAKLFGREPDPFRNRLDQGDLGLPPFVTVPGCSRRKFRTAAVTCLRNGNVRTLMPSRP